MLVKASWIIFLLVLIFVLFSGLEFFRKIFGILIVVYGMTYLAFRNELRKISSYLFTFGYTLVIMSFLFYPQIKAISAKLSLFCIGFYFSGFFYQFLTSKTPRAEKRYYDEKYRDVISILCMLFCPILILGLFFLFFALIFSFLAGEIDLRLTFTTLIMAGLTLITFFRAFLVRIRVIDKGIIIRILPLLETLLPFNKIRKVEVRQDKIRIDYMGKRGGWAEIKNIEKFIQVVKKYAPEKLKIVK